MITEQQYNNLKPFIDVIKMYGIHKIYVGTDIHAFKTIYDPIANENLNTSCGGCISHALDLSYTLIKEYEVGRV